MTAGMIDRIRSATSTAPSPTGGGALPKLNSQNSDIFGLLLIGSLPFAFLYEAGFIGQMFGTELVFLLMLPFLWMSRQNVPAPIRSTLWWLAAWFLVLFVTDIYRGTSIGDYLRGWARLIFFAMDIYVISKLLTTERRLLIWGATWSVAFSIATWQDYGEFATRWKFGVGFGLANTVAALALLIFARRRIALAPAIGLMCLALGVVSLFLNARNTFLSLSLEGLLLCCASFPAARKWLLIAWDRYGLFAMLVGLCIAYFAGLAYVNGAKDGLFGEEAREKLEAQMSDAADPVLAALSGGRAEFYSSTAAIADSPIVGYGSWARSAYYYNIYAEKLRAHGTPEQIRELDSKIYLGEPLIPTHSHLLGAWVEAGVVGALFWVAFVRRAFRRVRQALELTSVIDVMILLNCVELAWNVLFSPFGGDARLVDAFMIVLFLSRPLVSSPLTPR